MNDFTRDQYIADLHERYARIIKTLELQNIGLIKALSDLSGLQYRLPTMIFCKDCPNIDRSLINE